MPTLYRIFSKLLLRSWGMDIYKKKVWGLLTLITRRLWKNPNENKRYQSPHLNDMGTEYTANQCIPCHKQTRSECYSFILRSWKLPHFLVGLRKHFQYVSPHQVQSDTNVSNYFEKSKKNSHHLVTAYEDGFMYRGWLLPLVSLVFVDEGGVYFQLLQYK